MPDLPRNITRPVRRLYTTAAQRLLRALADSAKRTIAAGVFGADRFKAEAELRDVVRQVYADLTAKAPALARDALDKAAKHGHRYALERLSGRDIAQPAIDAMIRAELERRMVEANTAVVTQVPTLGHRAAQVASNPAMDAEQMATTVQRVLDRTADQGVVRIPDRYGRHWGLVSYTVAATTSAANSQMLDTIATSYRDAGVRLVRFTGVGSVHAACVRWEGTVLALDGPPGPRTVDGVQVAGTVAECRASGAWHPNCFPAETLVSAPSGVHASDARWYEGHLVVIHTASGDELSCTPNHPILTPEGWVPAGSLQVGRSVLRYHGGDERVDLASPNNQQIPARIGEVHDALRHTLGVLSVRVPAAPEQFHGDGEGSDVEIVFANSLLADRLDIEQVHAVSNAPFVVSSTGECLLPDEGAGFEFTPVSLHSSDGVMGGGDLGDTLLLGHPLPLASLGLASVGDVATADEDVADRGLVSAEESSDLGLRYARLVQAYRLRDPGLVADRLRPSGFELATQSALTDANGGCDLADGLAGLVTADDIVKVEVRDFAGHVYNLQSGDGWYVANGIVVHNCRHGLEPYSDGPYTPEPYPEADTPIPAKRLIERWRARQAAAITDAARTKARRKLRELRVALGK